MKKGSGKDAVVILDRWTKREITRYPCVTKAAEDLGIRHNSIYVALSQRQVAYECYWVYETKLPDWQPAVRRHVKTRGTKCPDKLKIIIENESIP
jgi:hypothetical protein